MKIFFRNVLKPLFRGLVKTIPLGGMAIEAADNIKKEMLGEEKNHNWLSIITQFLCIAALLYAFYTGAIDLNEFMDQIKNI